MAAAWGSLQRAALFLLPMAAAQLAMTPPRGWNSWDAFEWHGGNLTEDEFRATAQAMQANLLPFGYDTVTVRWTFPPRLQIPPAGIHSRCAGRRVLGAARRGVWPSRLD
jgi:hypothetical protein